MQLHATAPALTSPPQTHHEPPLPWDRELPAEHGQHPRASAETGSPEEGDTGASAPRACSAPSQAPPPPGPLAEGPGSPMPCQITSGVTAAAGPRHSPSSASTGTAVLSAAILADHMTRRGQGEGRGLRGGTNRGRGPQMGRGPGIPPVHRVRVPPFPIPLRNPKSCGSVWLRPAPRPGTRSQEVHEAPACVLSTWHCILSALLCVGNGLGHILAGLLADFLLQRRVLGTAPIRKLFSALNKDKPSSATQPFQHTCMACSKTLPISSQGMLLPAAFLVAAVPQSLWSFSRWPWQ